MEGPASSFSLCSGEIRTALADSNRQFSFAGLSPGQYRLLAWSKLEDVPYRRPRFLDRYAKGSTTVSLDEDSHATLVDVPLIEENR